MDLSAVRASTKNSFVSLVLRAIHGWPCCDARGVRSHLGVLSYGGLFKIDFGNGLPLSSFAVR